MYTMAVIFVRSLKMHHLLRLSLLLVNKKKKKLQQRWINNNYYSKKKIKVINHSTY